MTTKANAIERAIKAMDDAEIIYIWDEYAMNTNNGETMIYEMEAFDDFYSGQSALDIAARVFFGTDEGRQDSSFNPNRDYFYLDGYANPVSLDYVYNQYSNEFYGDIDIDELVDYIIDEDEDFGNDNIREILDAAEQEEDEDDEQDEIISSSGVCIQRENMTIIEAHDAIRLISYGKITAVYYKDTKKLNLHQYEKDMTDTTKKHFAEFKTIIENM